MCAASAERLPDGAVEDHVRGAVGGGALDALLEVPARHVHGAGEVGLLELVLLADVDDHGAVRRSGELVDVAGVDLADLFLHLADQLGAAGHLLRNSSKSIGIPILQKV